MSVILIVGGIAIFIAGLGIGSAITFALARNKIDAVAAAADAANARIAAQSEGAMKDLAEAHAKAEAMTGAIESAKLSTARAGSSVAGLIDGIRASREELDDAANRPWFSAPRLRAKEETVRLEPLKPAPRLEVVRDEAVNG